MRKITHPSSPCPGDGGPKEAPPILVFKDIRQDAAKNACAVQYNLLLCLTGASWFCSLNQLFYCLQKKIDPCITFITSPGLRSCDCRSHSMWFTSFSIINKSFNEHSVDGQVLSWKRSLPENRFFHKGQKWQDVFKNSEQICRIAIISEDKFIQRWQQKYMSPTVSDLNHLLLLQ